MTVIIEEVFDIGVAKSQIGTLKLLERKFQVQGMNRDNTALFHRRTDKNVQQIFYLILMS